MALPVIGGNENNTPASIDVANSAPIFALISAGIPAFILACVSLSPAKPDTECNHSNGLNIVSTNFNSSFSSSSLNNFIGKDCTASVHFAASCNCCSSETLLKSVIERGTPPVLYNPTRPETGNAAIPPSKAPVNLPPASISSISDLFLFTEISSSCFSCCFSYSSYGTKVNGIYFSPIIIFSPFNQTMSPFFKWYSVFLGEPLLDNLGINLTAGTSLSGHIHLLTLLSTSTSSYSTPN